MSLDRKVKDTIIDLHKGYVSGTAFVISIPTRIGVCVGESAVYILLMELVPRRSDCQSKI